MGPVRDDLDTARATGYAPTMEGAWRVAAARLRHAAAVATVAVTMALTGCGDEEPRPAAGPSGGAATGVHTSEPERAFAPLVWLHPEETRMPASGRWFLARARLKFADDHGCPDRLVAVGRRLRSERTEVTNWIFVDWLGGRPTYWRSPYDVHCELDDDRAYYADQHTRPYGGSRRAEGIGEREGWYLDLVADARSGQGRPRRSGRRTLLEGVPAYVERRDERVGGSPGLRLTYWLLYAMNEPRDHDGRIERALAHEGDWERVDVLLRRLGGDRYAPHAVVLHADAESRELPWRDVFHARGDGTEGGAHPLLLAARGSHAMAAASSERRCGDCPQWRTWRNLHETSELAGYDFGGAWGDIGAGEATTGPLGPHDRWPTAADLAKR